jgi:hypothetical protein
MFDDLRQESNDQQSSFFQDDLSDVEPLLDKKPEKKNAGLGLNLKFNSKNFLGMNAFQRFLISFLLLLVVCIMGSMILLIAGSISLPF